MAAVSLELAMRAGFEHFRAGRLGLAEGLCRQLLAQNPDVWQAMGLLGKVCEQTGRTEEALELWTKAAALHPDDPSLTNELGIAYVKAGRPAEALPWLKRTMELEPDAHGHYNYSKVLKDVGRQDEAAEELREAIRLSPTLFEAYENLGNIYKDRAQLEEAIALYRQATALWPHNSHRYANQLYSLTFHPEASQAEILKAHAGWDETVCRPLRARVKPHANDRTRGRRIRVGYVGAYFRNHCQSFFTMPLLSNHDHEGFEIYCYSDLAGGDAVTERLKGYADQWRVTQGMTDEQIAHQIRKDRIDILVDLTMHMAGNRLTVFARKPAPVQVTWLAYPGTTGLPAIDYRFSDPHLDPPPSPGAEVDALYAEKTWRLPETFWCYDPLTTEPAVNELPALSTGRVTFGCLNNFCKVSDRTLDLWAGVLRRVAGAKMIVMSEPGKHRERTLDYLAKRGVERGRVEFVEQVMREEYLLRYHGIDIGLDTVPYNGHTTSLDSFWMGVPVVTLVGKTVVGRAGLSQLTNLGLTELVAWTEEEFVDIAAGLAGDWGKLKKLRAELRGRMTNSPLGDGRRFARNVEAAFRTMWERWCAEAPRVEAREEIAASDDENLKVAVQHHQANRIGEAEACYRAILAENPGHRDALHYLGVLLGEGGRYEAAIELIRKSLEVDAEQARVWGSLGSYYARWNKLEEAERCLRKAIELQHDCPDAHSNLGAVLKLQGEQAGALAMFSMAAQLHPWSADAHYNWGTCLMGMGRFEESIDCFTRALAANPRHEGARHNLGRAIQERKARRAGAGR